MKDHDSTTFCMPLSDMLYTLKTSVYIAFPVRSTNVHTPVYAYSMR